MINPNPNPPPSAQPPSLFSKLNGYKTYIVAVAAIVYAVVGLWNKSIDQNTAVEMILGALGLGALRHGISTGV